MVQYARNFCSELTFAFGKQILTISQYEHVLSVEKPTKEDKVKLKTLK